MLSREPSYLFKMPGGGVGGQSAAASLSLRYGAHQESGTSWTCVLSSSRNVQSYIWFKSAADRFPGYRRVSIILYHTALPCSLALLTNCR